MGPVFGPGVAEADFAGTNIRPGAFTPPSSPLLARGRKSLPQVKVAVSVVGSLANCLFAMSRKGAALNPLPDTVSPAPGPVPDVTNAAVPMAVPLPPGRRRFASHPFQQD